MKLTFIYHNVPYSILIKTLYWEFHGTCLRGCILEEGFSCRCEEQTDKLRKKHEMYIFKCK